MYIPLTSEGHATKSSTESLHPMSADYLPEDMPLSLPSSLSTSLQQSLPFNLAQIELRFRLAQAEDALSELRHLLRITMGLRVYKSKDVGPSQRAGTRARNLINRFDEKVSGCAESYRVARIALLALDPAGEWQKRLRQLKDEDVRAPGRRDNESEGFREVPWIWRRHVPEHVSSPEQLGSWSDEELDSCEHTSQYYLILLIFICVGLRCEWVKSKARADRWHEEVQLVKEEMRCVLAFLKWKAVWWTKEGGRVLDIQPDIADGIRAYAAKQAHINRALARSFRIRWESAGRDQEHDREQAKNDFD